MEGVGGGGEGGVGFEDGAEFGELLEGEGIEGVEGDGGGVVVGSGVRGIFEDEAVFGRE